MERKELAALVGVSANSVSNWVRGRYTPGRDHLLLISAEFGIAADELCGVSVLRGSRSENGDPLRDTAVTPDAIVRRLADLNPELAVKAVTDFGVDLMAVLREAQAYCAQHRVLPGVD